MNEVICSDTLNTWTVIPSVSFFSRFLEISVVMAASLPQKQGMAGMPPQQQQPHLPPGAASAAGQQPPQGALREISPVFLCRIGQETVQDIVTRTMEIFQITRATQVLDIRLSASCRNLFA